jgi:uncharacterized protein YfiM (DUF2279 family)
MRSTGFVQLAAATQFGQRQMRLAQSKGIQHLHRSHDGRHAAGGWFRDDLACRDIARR